MIALEADIWNLMPITETAETGVDSSVTKAQSSRIAPLTIDEIPTDIKLSRPKFVDENVFFTLGGR
ncbi:MAG: hypothetical protein OEY77_13685 [Nitrospira sp.]|nr:hypothetical protein [Nitrospira sp.]